MICHITIENRVSSKCVHYDAGPEHVGYVHVFDDGEWAAVPATEEHNLVPAQALIRAYEIVMEHAHHA